MRTAAAWFWAGGAVCRQFIRGGGVGSAVLAAASVADGEVGVV